MRSYKDSTGRDCFVPDLIETFLAKETYDALTEGERDQLREHATARTWFVRASTQAAYLHVRLSQDCPPKLLRKLGIEAGGE